MKRILCITIIAVLLSSVFCVPAVAYVNPDYDNSPRVISLTIGSPYITINGETRAIDEAGSVPFIDNGRTMVPLRAIFEAFSLKVSWDDGVITGTCGNTEIVLTVGSRIAFRNERWIQLEVAPAIVNARTMVPLRFIAESLGAEVTWTAETQTIQIVQTPLYVELDGTRINIGDAYSVVESMLGTPDRIDPSDSDYKWHVYNGDYSCFLMVGIKNGLVEALYTNSRGFETNIAGYGDIQNKNNRKDGIALYYDSNDAYKAHAVMVVSMDTTPRREFDREYYKAQELQNFDATNAFRVNHGLLPLVWNDLAAQTARKHSQDMADRDYVDHITPEGLNPGDRFRRNGGRSDDWAENIAAGYLLGVEAFDGLVNSESHRDAMLIPSLKYLGVGHGYNI